MTTPYYYKRIITKNSYPRMSLIITSMSIYVDLGSFFNSVLIKHLKIYFIMIYIIDNNETLVRKYSYYRDIIIGRSWITFYIKFGSFFLPFFIKNLSKNSSITSFLAITYPNNNKRIIFEDINCRLTLFIICISIDPKFWADFERFHRIIWLLIQNSFLKIDYLTLFRSEPKVVPSLNENFSSKNTSKEIAKVRKFMKTKSSTKLVKKFLDGIKDEWRKFYFLHLDF